MTPSQSYYPNILKRAKSVLCIGTFHAGSATLFGPQMPLGAPENKMPIGPCTTVFLTVMASLVPENLKQFATELQLNQGQFSQCLDEP